MAAAPAPVRRRLSRRIALLTGGTGLLFALGTALVVVPAAQGAVERTAIEQTGFLVDAISAAYEIVDEKNRTHRAERTLRQVASAEFVNEVSILDARGVVRWSSRRGALGTTRGLYDELRTVSVDDGLLEVAVQLPWSRACVGCHDARADPVGAIVVRTDRDAATAEMERFHLVLGLGALVALVALVLLLVTVLNRLVGARVSELAGLMARAEAGDILVRARDDADDEIGRLSRSFNDMLRALTEMKASEIEREADLAAAREELLLQEQLQEYADKLERTNAALARRVAAQELLMEAAHALSSTLDKASVLARLVELLRDKLSWNDFALCLVRKDARGEAVLEAAFGAGAGTRPPLRGTPFSIGEGVCGLVAETGVPFHLPDLAASDHRDSAEAAVLGGQGSLLAVPMLHKGRVLGVIVFLHVEVEAFDDLDLQLTQAFAAQAATAIMNADLYEATLELSVTDPLTGLMNRRAMERRLEIELLRAQRFSMPLAVLMIDVDHFKPYNDRMGHLQGDQALIAVARTLADRVRKVDGVARFGGEEFCVILPRTDADAAVEVADKLREAVSALDLNGAADQPLGHLSISVGIAVYPQDLPPALEGSAEEALLRAADEATYEAKERGRDAVVGARELHGATERPALDEVGTVGATSS